jgi:hypothetical protein
MNADDQKRLDAMVMRQAEISLLKTEREVASFEAAEADKKRQNAQRQQQLAIDLRGRRHVSRNCSHKQGGTPKKMYAGKGDTALKKVILPDGFSMLIMCSICRLRVFSPHPLDQSNKVRKGETPQQANARVAKWVKDTAEFAHLVEMSDEAKSAEFTEAMDCGITMKVTDADGLPVFRRRPCDTYATAA